MHANYPTANQIFRGETAHFMTIYQQNFFIQPQFVTSSWGGRRYAPYVFTEQGVAMLSSVLNSERAVQVNIVIMRAFVKLRQLISTHRELAHKFEQLEKKVEKHDHEIHAIFEAIRRLMVSPDNPKRRIGFHP